ncbi:heavy-metal-associated domain-containing protein [Paraburkholderia hayleyella]|uniref:heavy-metal-associated domain-containing protein n=1 Tax=Paraburkholderia hayleyella TaxID=2152889 RepID=UPI0012910BEE|nr:cation transporter [Paraburkholderia hayleyella]
MNLAFKVEGMSCQHCVAAVTRAVQALDATARVEIDLAAGRVAIESAQPAATLQHAIEEAGYTVTAAPRNP